MRVELVIEETDTDSTIGTIYDRDTNRGLRTHQNRYDSNGWIDTF